MTSRFQRKFSPAALAVLNAYRDDVWVDGKYRHMSGLAGVIRTLAEELQYKMFLPGNDLRVVDAETLFDLADELDNAP